MPMSLISCGYNHKDVKSQYEIEDSLKKAGEDSINNVLRKIRIRANKVMSNDISVYGGIELGQTKKEYKKALNVIEKQIGYDGFQIDDITLIIQNPQFYKGKLYSVDFYYSYCCEANRVEYNSTPYYNPIKYIKPLVAFFENKYGLPDSRNEETNDILGHQHAVDTQIVWNFGKKRISISNEAEQYIL